MIRSMLFLHARPGLGSELLRALERLGVLAMAREQPGLLGIEVATAVGDDDDVVIVGFWSSQEHYERWREGPSPGLLLEQIESLLGVEPESRVYHIAEAVS